MSEIRSSDGRANPHCLDDGKPCAPSGDGGCVACDDFRPPSVFAFACRVVWAPQWGETIYNRATAGQAKRDHQLAVDDAWPGTKFTDIRVRKVGTPQSSERFIDCAKYRGMPDVRCGQAVKVGDSHGTIVGHNSSANFDVLFHDGKYNGMTLNVHPQEIELCQRT